MKKYILKRFLQLIPVLIGITFLSFAMMRIAGSDAITELYGDKGAVAQEIIDAKRAELGLDQPFFPNRSAIRSAYGSYKRSECGRVPILGTRPHFSFHTVMPATGFKSKRHRSHRKRNTWANTADSVLRIVQHGLAKTPPPALPRFFMATCLCSIGIRRFRSCGSHEPFAPKKWLPQCLGEPPNRPS